MTPIEELLWRAKPVDEISHELINAARAELTQLRADLATATHNHETVLKRAATALKEIRPVPGTVEYDEETELMQEAADAMRNLPLVSPTAARRAGIF